jgi:isopenicillin N synthase-like dioxygenase
MVNPSGMDAIPLLDLDTLTPSEFVAVLQRHSCVFLKGASVPVASAQQIYASGSAFLALPEAEKEKVAWPERGAWAGWQRMSGSATMTNLVERFEVRLASRSATNPAPAATDDDGIAAWAASFALWPENPPGFAHTWTRFYAEMHALTSRLIEMIAEALALDDRTLEDWTTRQWSDLVLNHYPPQSEAPAPGLVRNHPHTDFGALTLIWSNDRTGGLESHVRGGEWRKVDFMPGAMLLQAGDMLTRWTHGRIPSNVHRVVNPEQGSDAAREGRYSVVYFHHPDMATTIVDASGHAMIAEEHVRNREKLKTSVFG